MRLLATSTWSLQLSLGLLSLLANASSSLANNIHVRVYDDQPAPRPSVRVRIYAHLALASDHPTFTTRPAHPLLPRDLKSVPAWGGPKGPKAYNKGHDFLKDPTNVSLALEYLRLFEEGMGSSVCQCGERQPGRPV